MLLNIFHTGGLTLGLTIVWALLTGWFSYQSVKAHGSGGTTQGNASTGFKPILDDNKTPYTKIPQTWFAVAVTVIYIVAMLIVNSDYRGV